MREHVGLVTGGYWIEEKKFSIRNDARRIDIFAEHAIEPVSFCRFRNALVAATQNRDAAAAGLQRAREFLDHRSLAGAADGEIANTDDETTECPFAKNSFSIEIKPQLNNAFVNKRERVENSAQKSGAKSAAAAKHDVDSELLQVFESSAHPNC